MLFTQNINILIENPFHFFPRKDDSFEEQLNAIMRASIYIGILLSIYRGSLTPMILPAFVGISIFIVYEMYKLRKKKELKEKFSVSGLYRFTQPSQDNPYMNYLLTQRHDDQQKPKGFKRNSCPLYNRNVSRVADNYARNFYNDVDDVYNRTQSQRQFVTFASNDIVNDRDALLQWLNKDATHCKDANGQCHRGI
jgi:hypothetical protein